MCLFHLSLTGKTRGNLCLTQYAWLRGIHLEANHLPDEILSITFDIWEPGTAKNYLMIVMDDCK